MQNEFYEMLLNLKGWKENNKVIGTWREAHVQFWKLNKNFGCLNGNELRVFAKNATEIAEWLEKKIFRMRHSKRCMHSHLR